MAKLTPLGDRVLLEAQAEETTAGGIILAAQAQEKPQFAKVIDVGPKVEDVTPGDTVLFPRYGGTEVKFEGKTYHMLGEKDLLAIVGG